jgi:hypothetical protein
LTLTDAELEQWLVDLRHDAVTSSMAATIATGDERTRERLDYAADVRRRRVDWLASQRTEKDQE